MMNRKKPPLLRSKYQFFPPHPPARRTVLATSIDPNGPANLTVWDDQGNLLDGWERETICAEKAVPCPREVRHFENEAEKFRFILAVNAHRRLCLSSEQKREVIAGYLKGDPEVADNALGDSLGVSKNTVLSVRRRLEANGEIPKIEKTRGKDGKFRPVKNAKRIITNTPNEFMKALEAIGDLPDNCSGKIVDVTTAARRARRNRKKAEADGRIVEPLTDGAIQIFHCRFQELEQRAGILPSTVNLISTDIPYGAEFLPQLDELGAFAQRVLADGGLFVTYCGHAYLDRVMKTLGTYLTYRWMLASTWEGGGGNLYFPLQLVSRWKPILLYSKGDWSERDKWHDVLRSNSKEKNHHEWQQSLVEAEWLLRYFSDPGDLVVDPCGGGFTTAEACLRRNRRCISCDVEAECVSEGLERLKAARNSIALGE